MKPFSKEKIVLKRRKRERKKTKHVQKDLTVNVLNKSVSGSSNWEQLSKVIGYDISKRKSTSHTNLLMDAAKSSYSSNMPTVDFTHKIQGVPKTAGNSKASHSMSDGLSNSSSNSLQTAVIDFMHNAANSLSSLNPETRPFRPRQQARHVSHQNTYAANSLSSLNPETRPFRPRQQARLVSYQNTYSANSLSSLNPETRPFRPRQQARYVSHQNTSNIYSSSTPQNRAEIFSQRHGITRVVAMDCEMVGTGADGVDSMIARVSLVNQWGDCLYDSYVKPMETVTDYRTPVSGIRPHDLTKGKDLFTVQSEVQQILDGRILVGHALKNDLNVLFISHPKTMTRDTSRYKPFRELFNGRTPSLKKLAEKLLGAQIQTGEHSSVEDAQAAMQIYLTHKREWENTIKFIRRRRMHHHQQQQQYQEQQ